MKVEGHRDHDDASQEQNETHLTPFQKPCHRSRYRRPSAATARFNVCSTLRTFSSSMSKEMTWHPRSRAYNVKDPMLVPKSSTCSARQRFQAWAKRSSHGTSSRFAPPAGAGCVGVQTKRQGWSGRKMLHNRVILRSSSRHVRGRPSPSTKAAAAGGEPSILAICRTSEAQSSDGSCIIMRICCVVGRRDR